MAMIIMSLVWRFLSQKADKSTTYTKTEVDDIMKAKQNTLSFIDAMNEGTPLADYLILVGSNIIPGLSVQLPLTLTRNANNYLMIGISTIIFSQFTLSVNTRTTNSETLNIKSNQVLLKGNYNYIYLDAHLGGVMCWTDLSLTACSRIGTGS